MGPRRPMFDRRLAAMFYAAVIVNGGLALLERSTHIGESPLYLVALVPAVLVLLVTGFLLLREVFRRLPER